jgi:hypothetical protein
MRVLVVVFLLGAVGAAAVSWSGRHSLSTESFMYTPVSPGVSDIEPSGRDLVDETLDARGFDAYGAMRGDDSRLWLGVAVALIVSAAGALLAAIFRQSRMVAGVLIVLALGSLVLSLVNHDHLRVRSMEWTSYTPVDSKRMADEFRRRVTAYSAMPWDDARLWLGLAVGLGVSAAGVGVVALRRRAR